MMRKRHGIDPASARERGQGSRGSTSSLSQGFDRVETRITPIVRMCLSFNVRRFQYSVRTLFVAITIGSAWLAWNVHRVGEHNRVAISLLKANGKHRTNIVAAWDGGDEEFKLNARFRLPFVWRFLGALPVDSINLDEHEFTESDHRYYSRLFPEARVSRY
jgi:hypothetical protein